MGIYLVGGFKKKGAALLLRLFLLASKFAGAEVSPFHLAFADGF